MRVFEVGGAVRQLQFVPNSSRLLVGAAKGVAVGYRLLDLTSGELTPLAGLNVVKESATAMHPGGRACYIARNGRLLAFRTADGSRIEVPEGVAAYQVIASDNGHLLALSGRTLTPLATGPDGGDITSLGTLRTDTGHLAGFLPGGGRYVTVENRAVRVRAFPAGERLAAGHNPAYVTNRPQVSPGGETLALASFSQLHFWDLADLGGPRSIDTKSKYRYAAPFALHPAGRTLAVIDRAPTLVKLYDLAILTRVRAYDWKLGPLTAVAYSPDGTLGAAGSESGRVVVWDADE